MITMTKTEEKQKELEARIIELEELVQELNDQLDVDYANATDTAKLARAISELQDMFPELPLINRLHVPTKVGQS